MTWKKKLLIVVPVLAGGLALAGWRCHHRASLDPAEVSQRVTARVNHALDDLGATPEQRTQILAIKDRLLTDGLALHAAQKGARTEMLAQWDAKAPDAAKVHALVDARVDALRAFAHEAADAAIQVHGVLTPDQQAKVSQKLHGWMDGK